MKRVLWNRKRAAAAGLALAASLTVGMGLVPMAALAAPGTAAYNSNIRASASADAESVGAVNAGDSLELGDTTTGSDGQTWYAVTTSGGTQGYIRGDLVKLSESSSDAGQSDGGTEQPAESAAPAGDSGVAQAQGDGYATAMSPTAATISGDCNIRSGAGTNYNKIGTLPAGTALVVIGQAADGAGKTWYQFYTTGTAQQMTGFVIQDYITLGEAVQTAPVGGEGEQPAENTEQNAAPADYEAVYTADENGQETWYLYNNVEGTREKISDIDQVVVKAQENQAAANKKIASFRMAAIALAVVAVLLLIAVTLLILKLRDMADGGHEVDLAASRARERKRGRNVDDISDLETDSTGASRSARMRQSAYPSRVQSSREGRAGERPPRGVGAHPAGSAARPAGASRPSGAPSRPAAGSRPAGASRSAGPEQERPARRPVRETGAPQGRPSAERGRRPADGYDELPRRSSAPQRESRNAQPRNFAYDDDLDYEFLDLDNYSRKE